MLTILVTVVTFASCGSANVFDPVVNRTQKEEARRDLEKNNYDTAISHLNSWLAKHPNDDEARGMLAVAYARKGGMDPLAIAAQIASGASQGGDSSFLQTLAGSLPASDSAALAALGSAIDVLKAIPAESRTPEQNMQLALSQVTYSAAIVKSTIGEDGKIDPSKVDALTDEQAALAAQNILDAPQTLAQAGQADGSNAQKLSQVSSSMQGQSGASDGEKLKAFLKSR